MDKVEVILEDVVFEAGIVVTLEKTIVEIKIEKIGYLGDSPD